MKLRDNFLLTCLLILLFSGCTKRYWYRNKIDVPHSKKYSVEIKIVNRSPEFLNNEFIDAMHKAATKSLEKFGYYETRAKSTRFVYTLVLSVDSFYKPVNTLYYKFGIGHIIFKAQLDDTKYGRRWSRDDYIHFFAEKRDVSRSASVVRHLIRISEQKRYEY
jgi:hypothetical protein